LSPEYGKLVVHILDNSYLNGSSIRLDGGIRIPIQKHDPKRFERKYGKPSL
jgi:hypothetical protein